MGYAKIWSQITESSINDAPLHVRWLWVVLLAKANRHGQVFGTVNGLARMANLSVEQTREAVEILSSPDGGSSSAGDDGRRLEALSGNLWQIVNYLRYRTMRDADDEREATRMRVEKHRSLHGVKRSVTDVTPGNKCNAIAEAEAEAEAETTTLVTEVAEEEPHPVEAQGPPQAAEASEDHDQAVDRIDYALWMGRWNDLAGPAGMPTASKLTDARRRAMRARLGELGEAGLIALFKRATASEFLRGGGPRGWQADLDWILKPDHVARILEGRFDGAAARASPGGRPVPKYGRNGALLPQPGEYDEEVDDGG